MMCDVYDRDNYSNYDNDDGVSDTDDSDDKNIQQEFKAMISPLNAALIHIYLSFFLALSHFMSVSLRYLPFCEEQVL